MENKEIYTDLLVETMEKKHHILEQIIQLTIKQGTILDQIPFVIEHFDEILDEKAELIRELNQLDQGFTMIYDRVREEVSLHKYEYQNKVLKMQELIRLMTEKSTTLQFLESSNKHKMEGAMTKKRSEIRQFKINNQSASAYYKNMMNLNQNDAIFYDQKK